MSSTVSPVSPAHSQDTSSVTVSIGVEDSADDGRRYGYVIHNGPHVVDVGMERALDTTSAQTLRCRAVRRGVIAAQTIHEPDSISVLHRERVAAGLGLALGNIDLRSEVTIQRVSASAPLHLLNAFLNHHILDHYPSSFGSPLPEKVVLHVDGSGGETLACGWTVTTPSGDLLQCAGRNLEWGTCVPHAELAAIVSGLLSIPASSDVQQITVNTDSRQAIHLYDDIGRITDETLATLARESKFKAGNWRVKINEVNRDSNYLAHSCARAARYESFASYDADWLHSDLDG